MEELKNNTPNTEESTPKMEVISLHTYKPGKQNEKVFYKVRFCNNRWNCTAYLKGQCALCNGLFGGFCPYGKEKKQYGPTLRAKSSYKFLEDAKEQYKPVEEKWLHPIQFTCEIGDYVFLALEWLDNYVNPIAKELDINYDHFIKKENFTAENIIKLIEFKPRALMGGVISDYQDKLVPTFVRHLKRYFPDKYEEVRKVKPEIANYIIDVNYVGKKAYVKTLLPGKVQIGSNPFTWDGEKLVSRAKGLILFSGLDEEEVAIIPNDKTVVTISENQIVTENTEFMDE